MLRTSFGADAKIDPGVAPLDDSSKEKGGSSPQETTATSPPSSPGSQEARVLRVFSRSHLKSSPAHASQIEQVERLYTEFEVGTELQRQHLAQAQQRQKLATHLKVAARKARLALAVSAAFQTSSKDEIMELPPHTPHMSKEFTPSHHNPHPLTHPPHGNLGGGAVSPTHHPRVKDKYRSGSFSHPGVMEPGEGYSVGNNATQDYRYTGQNYRVDMKPPPSRADSDDASANTPSKWTLIRRKHAGSGSTFGEMDGMTLPTPRAEHIGRSQVSGVSGAMAQIVGLNVGKLDASKLAIMNIELEQSLANAKTLLDKETLSRAELEEELM